MSPSGQQPTKTGLLHHVGSRGWSGRSRQESGHWGRKARFRPVTEGALELRVPDTDHGKALAAVTGLIESVSGRQAGESWAEALGRLTEFSAYELKRYLYARAGGHSHEQAWSAHAS